MENKNKNSASVDGDEKFGDYYLSMSNAWVLQGVYPACRGRKL